MDGVVCKSQKEINEVLEESRWGLFMSDVMVDATNFETPYINMVRNLFGWVSNKMFKMVEVSF